MRSASLNRAVAGGMTRLVRALSAAVVLAALCAVPASAAGIAEVSDPSGDAGAGAKGTTDMVLARWDGFDLTLTVAKAGDGTTELTGRVFLDTDADSVPDWVVRFSRPAGDTSISWELAPSGKADTDCADDSQAAQTTGSTTATATSTKESFLLAVPGAQHGISSTFRWAVQGQNPTADPKAYGFDYLPDGAQPGTLTGTVGSKGCTATGIWLHMAGGVAYPPPSASYSVAPGAPVEGDTVTLTSNSTGEIATSEWDLNGDGTYGDATGGTATTSFKAGTHDVGLLVSDAHGEHDAMRTTITVAPAPTQPSTSTPTPAPTQPSTSTPTAAIALAAGSTRGAALRLDASGSRGSAGHKIIDFKWDFNDDGHIDADTGNSPFASYNSHGKDTSPTVTVTDEAGFVAQTQLDLPAERFFGLVSDRCPSHQFETRILGFTITGSCVTEENGRVHVRPIDTGWNPRFVVYFGGTPLETGSATNEIVIDRSAHPRHIRSTSQWKAIWLNPPTTFGGSGAPMALWKSDPSGFDFALGLEQQIQGERVTPIAHLQAMQASTGPGQTRDDCRHDAEFGSSCADVGGLPITGWLDLAWDHTTSEMILDVQVELHFQITITGGARLRFDVDTGNVRPDTLRIGVGDINIGVLQVHRLRFEFHGPTADQPGLSWQAVADFGLLNDQLRAAGRVAFVNGRFCYANVDVRVTPGIPVYAAFVDRFRAAVLHDCGRGPGTWGFGGGVGVNLAAVARIDADFDYETRSDGLSLFSMEGRLAIFGAGLANAHSEWWSDGYFGWGGGVDFHYPETSSVLHIVARMDGWSEPHPSGTANWQMAGYGTFTIGRFSAAAITGRGFINQRFVAGCGTLRIAVFSTGGCGYYEFSTGRAFSLGTDDSSSLTPYAAVPTHTAVSIRPGATAARAASDATTALAFDVRPGQSLLNLTVEGMGGMPDVTLTDPNGKVYAPNGAATKGAGFESWQVGGLDQQVFVLHNPAGGQWTLSPRSGSAPVKELLGAPALPKLKITTSVRGKGRERTLVWRAPNLAGRTIRFVERGANVASAITTTKAETGHARFTLQMGSAGPRTVQALVTSAGLPTPPVTVGHFSAPGPPKAGRVGRVNMRRRGYVVTAAWRKLRDASGYVVTVRGTDGRRERHLVKRAALRLPNVSPLTRLVVTVRAYTVSPTKPGPPRTAKLRPAKTSRKS